MRRPAAPWPYADVETIEKVRSQYDDLAVVCYVNSTAAVKAVSDVCVTSSNAVKIVRKLPNKHISLRPTRIWVNYVSTQVPDKHFILNNGFCPRHDTVDPAYVKKVQAAHPQALFLAHPECRKEVLALADYVAVRRESSIMPGSPTPRNLSSVRKAASFMN